MPSPQLNKEIQLVSELYKAGCFTTQQDRQDFVVSPILTNRNRSENRLHKNLTNHLFLNHMKSKFDFEANETLTEDQGELNDDFDTTPKTNVKGLASQTLNDLVVKAHENTE
jgi:hypothetical protein